MLNYLTFDSLNQMYWGEHLSGKQIAARLGCTPAAISMKMKELGIPARHATEYPPTEKKRKAWIENGKRLGTMYGSKERGAALGKSRKGTRKRNDYEFGGHEKLRSDGYIKVYVPEHPNATKDGYVMKHILVVEKNIGRHLQPDEVVHHINHVRDDNRIENLRLMTMREHCSMHMKERYEKRRRKEC